jgi:Flp pilus assembly protein TadG
MLVRKQRAQRFAGQQQKQSMAAGGGLFHKFQRERGGAAAVEFAIVASIFLTIVLGILAYGLYFGTAHGVAQLAADAARASVAGLSDIERTSLATAHVTRNAPDFVLLKSDKITIEAAASPNDANQFQVILHYDASNLPIWFMSGLVPLPAKTITRSASIKRGGY